MRTSSGFIPRFSFGGVPSAPNVSYDNRLLTGGTDFTFNFSDSVAITRGTHNIKVGFDVYRIREYEGEQSIFSGTFDFGRNTLEPAGFELRLLQRGARRFQQLHRIQRPLRRQHAADAWSSGSRRIVGR